MDKLKCPALESSEHLCDRDAEYQINGTIYCLRHAQRIMKGGRAREATEPAMIGRTADEW